MSASVTAASPVGEETVGLDLKALRSSAFDPILLGALVLWMLYAVSGFRLPTSPILLSDENAGSGLRQVLFSAAGMIAISRLVLSKRLAHLLVLRSPMTLLTALILGSVLWSELPTVTAKRGLLYVFGWLALTVMVHSSKRPAKVMLTTVVAFTASMAAASLLFYVVLPENCTVNPARPGLAGVAIHPNTLAPFMSIGLLLSMGIRTVSPVGSLWLLIARGLLAVALVLTFSMTTLMATFVGMGVYLFLNARSYFRGTMQLVACALVAFVSLVGPSTLRSAFFDATGRDESLSGRDELWAVVWAEYKESSVLGNGFGAFWTEGKGRELVQTWNPRQSHNAYLDVLLDLGAVGLIAVLVIFPLGLLLAWFRHGGTAGSAQRQASAAMVAVAFAYMVVYAFGQSFFLRFDAFPFFILTWITLILNNPDQNNLSAEFGETQTPPAGTLSTSH